MHRPVPGVRRGRQTGDLLGSAVRTTPRLAGRVQRSRHFALRRVLQRHPDDLFLYNGRLQLLLDKGHRRALFTRDRSTSDVSVRRLQRRRLRRLPEVRLQFVDAQMRHVLLQQWRLRSFVFMQRSELQLRRPRHMRIAVSLVGGASRSEAPLCQDALRLQTTSKRDSSADQ